MNGNLANNCHENLNERKPTENKTVGGEHTEIALEIDMKKIGVLIMQLSLQLSRLDKIVCYSTFCDDQFICLNYLYFDLRHQ